jgi:hypothetical protein
VWLSSSCSFLMAPFLLFDTQEGRVCLLQFQTGQWEEGNRPFLSLQSFHIILPFSPTLAYETISEMIMMPYFDRIIALCCLFSTAMASIGQGPNDVPPAKLVRVFKRSVPPVISPPSLIDDFRKLVSYAGDA